MQKRHFFSILDGKRLNNLLKKDDIYQYYDWHRTQLSSIYKIAQLTEKKFESVAQLKRKNFKDFFPQSNFRNVSK